MLRPCNNLTRAPVDSSGLERSRTHERHAYTVVGHGMYDKYDDLQAIAQALVRQPGIDALTSSAEGAACIQLQSTQQRQG